MESLIRRRINSLIKVTKHGEKALSTFQLDGDVQNVSFKIEPPAHADDIEKIKGGTFHRITLSFSRLLMDYFYLTQQSKEFLWDIRVKSIQLEK